MDSTQDRGGRLAFPPFVLDAANARLSRGTAVIRLRSKSLAVLEYLAQRPGRLVTKTELLEALWPETYVTETALAGCVRELRLALGDSRGEPRFIETVYGRGYRFVAAVSRQSTVDSREASPKASPQFPVGGHHVVGRDGELAQLGGWLQLALDGRRQVVFVPGDVGIGKTTLVNAFIDAVRRRASAEVLVARGQCIEQYGPGEPFLPVLEALARASRADAAVAATVRRCVPHWLLPHTGERVDLQPGADATPERSVRILVQAIETLAAERAVLLVVEDLHWSDPSTLDVLSYLAQRPDPARLLVLGTYRPVDVIIRRHPLRVMEQELRRRRQSAQLALRLLSRGAVAGWLENLCPAPPSFFVEWLYKRTDGHPFFLSALLEDMKATGLVEYGAGGWTVSPRFTEMGVPQSLRMMIDQQIDRLEQADQQLLQAASAAGVQFSAATVGAGLGGDTVEAEERCNALARRGQFLRAEQSIDWPDGTVAGGYAFLHELYQNVLYERLPPARRQQLHARIAQRLERGYGAQAEDFAIELAVHCERGRDLVNAIRHRERAAQHCNQRGAHREAAASLRRALELVESLPDPRDRLQQTLWLSLMLGATLIPITGYADAELLATFQRCCDLAEQLGEQPQLFAALTGLATCYFARGELPAASPVSERLLQLAEAMPVPIFDVLAHTGAGWLRCCRGNFSGAVEHLVHATAVHRAEVPRETINIDPGTLGVTALCLALLPLGRVEEARVRMAQEIARCRQSERAVDRVTVLASSGLLHGNLGEAEVAAQHAAEALAVAAENGVREPPIAATIHAWALAVRDASDAALAHLVDRVAAYRAAGFGTYLSAILNLAATAHGRAGKIEAGLRLLGQAVDHMEATGERWCEPELYRLRGELLAVPRSTRGRGKARAKRRDYIREAENWIECALDAARRQGARLWQLRATVSLARLRHEQGRTADARALLESIAIWFPAGQDVPDLHAAHTLLARLG
jgi:DNA-binding winged helix-turn-helix (wHTH) protein/tetratricopeptide (TPR) repeat protein